MSHLRLSEIWIYPIKSLGGIRLNIARVLPKGLQFDRRWMLIDDNGTFMTQRIYPQMALFKLSINHNHITVTFRPSNQLISESITLDADEVANGEIIQAKIWNDTVETVEVNPEFSKWFTEKLNIRCRLVHFPETKPRAVEKEYQLNNEQVSLADAYPFLIIGQSSLDDLNSRLEEKVGMNRFRPNFVFTGGVPYEEDEWNNFSIGNLTFAGVKPCARCVLTTVDQNTGTKGTEPLATLSKYRKSGSKVLFGQNVLPVENTGGYIHEGDTIIVNRQTIN